MSGRTVYGIGLGLMALFAAGHLTGFVMAARAARNDPRLGELTTAMRGFRFEVLGFRPSMLDFREYFSLNFSILLVLGAALGVVLLRAEPYAPGAIRASAMIYAIAMLLLLVSSLIYSVAQGIVSSAVILATFLAAWWYS